MRKSCKQKQIIEDNFNDKLVLLVYFAYSTCKNFKDKNL